MKLDLNQTAEAILLDLIWRSNGIRILEGDAEFGLPRAITNPGPWGPDTVVTITAVQEEMDTLSGAQDLAYCRLQLADVITLPATTLSLPAFPFQSTDLLASLNLQYGLQLLASDVENVTYADASTPVILTASATSLIYTGAVQLSAQSPQPALMVHAGLNGFHVAPVSP